MVERHGLWRMVEHDYTQLEKLAPDGYGVAAAAVVACGVWGTRKEDGRCDRSC